MWGTNPHCLYQASAANHRINRGAGGSKLLNVLVNGCAICGPCNGLIESDPDVAQLARDRGVKVRRSSTIARDFFNLVETPLNHPVRGVYFLDAEGGVIGRE